MKKISAAESLDRLKSAGPSLAMIDVRSEGEAAAGELPGFHNLPILTNPERHAVGTTYKEQGQAQAIELGHRLTESSRAERTRKWVELARASTAREVFVTCWRGGLRSQIACEWMEAELRNEATVYQIAGGYKAMRAELLKAIATDYRWVVVSGNTGSGKTSFLTELTQETKLAEKIVDLEAMANHRGSSFGASWKSPQPSQASFENRLGLKLWRQSPQTRLLVEDESICIGKIVLPEPTWAGLSAAPLVVLRVPLEQRVRNIFRDYIEEPLRDGLTPDALRDQLVRSLNMLRKKLGNDLADRLVREIHEGLPTEPSESSPVTLEKHRFWIETLLTRYYDRIYEHGRTLRPRKVFIEGTPQECREWLLHSFQL